MCGEEGCKHPVLGSSLGTKCGCLNSAWIQQYAGDLGLENIVCIGYPWTCSICMEAREGFSEHCGLTAERHVEEILVWLTDLMRDTGNDNIAIDELEVCDEGFIFKQLTMPHGQVDQGFIASGWRTVNVDVGKCQCTLAQATSKINLLAKNLQPMEQNIPKEVPKGPLWGLREWNKGEVCVELLTPHTSATPVSYN